jgi:hypothetical protein
MAWETARCELLASARRPTKALNGAFFFLRIAEERVMRPIFREEGVILDFEASI